MAENQTASKETEKGGPKKSWEQVLDENSQQANTKGTESLNEAHKFNNKKGVELLVDKILRSSVRLPILEVTYDRLVRIASTSFRNYTSENVEVEIVSMESKRFGEYMEKVAMPSMISVFKVTEWDNFGLIVIDAPMIYTFVEILFGGRKITPSLKVEGRPFTLIENGVVKSITEILLNDLGAAFNPIASATFQLDRMETNPKFAMIVRPEDVAIVLRLRLNMDARSGCVDIVLPYSTIEPVKKILSKPYIGERGSKDPNWARHFENEISKATVKMEVVLNSIVTELKDIASFEVGKTIMLDKTVGTDWEIRLNHTTVSMGQPGKVGDKLAIRLNDDINIERYRE